MPECRSSRVAGRVNDKFSSPLTDRSAIDCQVSSDFRLAGDSEAYHSSDCQHG